MTMHTLMAGPPILRGGRSLSLRSIFHHTPPMRTHLLSAYPTSRGFGQGFDFSQIFGGSPSGGGSNQTLTTAGNVVGAAVGIPGAGSIASGVVSTVQSIFGGNPATGKDAERQAKVYSIYETAMTAPGSAPSVDAVIELYAMATQQPDPVTGVVENNPQSTRTYAQQALQMLSTQGWQNVNSFHPTFSGVPASGVVYGANTQGQQIPVGQRGIIGAGGPGYVGGPSLTTLLFLGGVAYFVLGRGSRSSASATVHHTSSNPRRRRRHNRTRRRRATR